MRLFIVSVIYFVVCDNFLYCDPGEVIFYYVLSYMF